MFASTWGVPDERIPLTVGLKVTQIVQETSPVRGMYIMGENPILSDPEVAHAEHWFRELEFLAVQDLFLTETARYADVVLPGASFAEKTGTFVNTERRIQLSHKAVDAPGDARGDLEIIIDLSRRIGLETPFETSADVMDEIAKVTPSWRGVSHARLEGNGGLQYPVPHAEHPGTDFLFDDEFPTTDGKATFVGVEFLPPSELPDDEFPFMLNTGRQMYHWHTGTMTRRSFALDAREPGPIVELNPADAEDLGVGDGDEVSVASRRGEIRISVRLSDRVARRQVFIPMHYREAAVNLLTNPELDPYAHIPEFKVCAVSVAKVEARGQRPAECRMQNGRLSKELLRPGVFSPERCLSSRRRPSSARRRVLVPNAPARRQQDKIRGTSPLPASPSGRGAHRPVARRRGVPRHRSRSSSHPGRPAWSDGS
jgi:predicted molibdopterin-dependent oxidoreductase YjgC